VEVDDEGIARAARVTERHHGYCCGIKGMRGRGRVCQPWWRAGDRRSS
jgi:hypothetical protein